MGHQNQDDTPSAIEISQDASASRDTNTSQATNPPEASSENPNLITGATDAELAAAVSMGDEEAFETLFHRHRRRVGIIAGRFFHQRQEIEDVVQECFAKAYFAIKNFSDEGADSMAAWLSKIAFNVCYDELRRRRRKPESTTGDLTSEETQTIRSLIAASDEVSIESAAVTRDLANKLLSRLSADDRIVLVLLEVEGLSVAEIGQVIGWSSAKVKIRAFRARNHLRHILGRFL